MSGDSAVGNVADLASGQVLLPAFVVRQSDGLYIDLTAIDARSLILQFVERVFTAGARFAGLDYELFLDLLFHWEPVDIDQRLAEFKRKNIPPRLRLARDIVSFPEERRAIYRGVKIATDGSSVDYLFEQVSVEREVDAESADGAGKLTVLERLYADFDEFIAALWEKGVRYGIDAKVVREAIARDKNERLVIAHRKVAEEGKDASVDEQTDLLHRDDAPRLLPNGRMDLGHYRNRFPQVAAGTRLFKKVPRVLGHSGWDVQGKELLPAAVKDFDIESLAGIGTEVRKNESGEYVVAAQNGFLDIDAKSGQISVVDKIVGREGVSMRTTGNLTLEGAEYEEHGEVQERRVVEGHDMVFLADVFGKIVSDGGRITLKQNLSGGAAKSPGGAITVEGTASRATLEAPGGEIVAASAENCLIVAAKVRIERAVSCDIVADEAEIGQSEGSAVVAKRVVLQSATVRKEDATVVTLMLPDMDAFDLGEAALKQSREEAEAEKDSIAREIKELAERPDMKSYMTLQPKIKAGNLVMNPKQALQWQELLTRLAPALRQLSARNIALKAAYERIAGIDQELAESAQARAAALAEVSCSIGDLAGDTLVLKMQQSFATPPLASLPAKDLHKRLRGIGTDAARLFSGNSGSFEWHPPTAEDASAAEAEPDGTLPETG